MAKKKWSDLSTGQKRGIALSGAVQIGLLIAALGDIYRRPVEQIRGSKWAWTVVSFQSTVGAARALLLSERLGWLRLHAKPPPFTGGWENQEVSCVVLDLEGVEYNVDLSEKVRSALPSRGGA